ncbi:MAG: methyltransferase domain-containing protein [Kofleriaceae bacterium]|nr:methyltransferase domain-containing protein [Kofleriaceae bacterium]MCB9573135.1 methyltransferase domain-containing protein [Kofleriaceae bacterium]
MTTPAPTPCAICGAPPGPDVETATVPSNVRAHRDERFAVWRCGACRSIHARDDVDLDHYYRDYPFLRARDSRVLRYFQRRLWRRVERAGARRDHAVLDYGCGGGLLVTLLRRRGWAGATGYDAYAEAWADPATLDARYDVVFSQDVIEHVADPLALLATFERLCRPGGLIAIGTPDAAAIDLADVDRHRHSLHQPYHRHVLAHPALIAAARARGWRLVAHHRRPYTNTPVPTLNQPYLLRYLRAFDDTVDVAYDPPRVSWRMFTPGALFDAVFGGLRCPPTEGLAIFRTPAPALAAAEIVAAAAPAAPGAPPPSGILGG